MAMVADSIRRLTRAYVGAAVYQGLLFWILLMHNIKAALTDLGYLNRSLTIWLTVGAIVAAATLGTYYQWRFGRVEPPKPSLSRQVLRATAFAGLLIGTFMAMVVVAGEAEDWRALSGARPMDLVGLFLSAGAAWSLATSRGERLGWVVPLLASAGLLITLVVPALQPYRAMAHAGMAAALVVTAVQLHLFLVRGFRHAHI